MEELKSRSAPPNRFVSMERLHIIRSSFPISTWLLLGATLQSFVSLIFSRYKYLALLPACLLLLTRIINGAIIYKGWAKNHYLPEKYMAKMTAPIPNADGSVEPGKTGVVCFIVGANINHPMGIFAPNVKEIYDYFQGMWNEAAASREQWGFIGKSSSLTMPTPGGGTALLTVSYWRSHEHLHAFAHAPVHKAGWDWFGRINKAHPHIGIVHETFAAGPGAWENVYKGCWPIGMGQAEYRVQADEDAEPRLVHSLMDAKGGEWRSMKSRMGGLVDVY